MVCLVDGNYCKVMIYGHGFVSIIVDGVSTGLDQVMQREIWLLRAIYIFLPELLRLNCGVYLYLYLMLIFVRLKSQLCDS